MASKHYGHYLVRLIEGKHWHTERHYHTNRQSHSVQSILCSVQLQYLQFILRNVLVSKILVSLLLFRKTGHRTPRTCVLHRLASLEAGEDIKSSANEAKRGNKLSAFMQNSRALLPE